MYNVYIIHIHFRQRSVSLSRFYPQEIENENCKISV